MKAARHLHLAWQTAAREADREDTPGEALQLYILAQYCTRIHSFAPVSMLTSASEHAAPKIE